MTGATHEEGAVDSLALRLRELVEEVAQAEGLVGRLYADLQQAERHLEQARMQLAIQDDLITRLQRRASRRARAVGRARRAFAA